MHWYSLLLMARASINLGHVILFLSKLPLTMPQKWQFYYNQCKRHFTISLVALHYKPKLFICLAFQHTWHNKIIYGKWGKFIDCSGYSDFIVIVDVEKSFLTLYMNVYSTFLLKLFLVKCRNQIYLIRIST